MGRISVLFTAALFVCTVVPTYSGEHSLFYTYTALSKPLHLPGIYEFTALGMLDDRELDYYNSETQVKIPKQNWMREKMGQDYWDKGTQSRKSKEQWFKVNVDILMDRMRHNKTDLHVLQWRHGCVVEGENGHSRFVRGIDEYSYDGSEFLSFDEENSRWIAPVQAAEPTKKKWDEVPILNTYTKSYLEKECVDWLHKFMDYGQEEIKRHSPPVVHIFAKKSLKYPGRLTLTCSATGFYPKDIEMYLRKGKTKLPDHLMETTGVRPNGDGTYQQRKSVEILESEKELYDCYVNHITLEKPIITPPGEEIPCLDCSGQVIQSGVGGAVAGVVITLLVVAVVVSVLIKKGKISWRRNSSSTTINADAVPFIAPVPAPAPGSLPVSPLLSNPAPAPDSPLVSAPVSTPAPAPAPAIGSNDGKKEPDTSSDTDSGQGSSNNGSPEGSQDNVNKGTESSTPPDSNDPGGAKV